MSAPSITLNAKVLAFVAALWVLYKEARIIIEKQMERDLSIGWLQKDVEQLKRQIPKL